jgi:hypothetical protein
MFGLVRNLGPKKKQQSIEAPDQELLPPADNNSSAIEGAELLPAENNSSTEAPDQEPLPPADNITDQTNSINNNTKN